MLCRNAYHDAFQESILTYVSFSLGLVAALACLSLFFGWLRMKERPSLFSPNSMILWLTLSDLCLGINTILEGLTPACGIDPSLCIFKACISQFFGLSSFLWSAAMSHSSYVQVSQFFLTWGHASSGLGSRYSSNQRHDRRMLWYHLVCWGVPLASTVIMLGTSSAGPSGSHFCWIATDREDNESILPLWTAIVLYLLPLVCIEAFNIYVFRFLAKTLRQIPSGNHLLQRFTRYLAIVIGTKGVFLMTRALRLLEPGNTFFALGVFAVLGAPLQGIGDYLIFRAGPGSGAGTGAGDRGTAGTNSLQSVSRGQARDRGGEIEGEGGVEYMPVSMFTTQGSTLSGSSVAGMSGADLDEVDMPVGQGDEERRMSQVSLLGGPAKGSSSSSSSDPPLPGSSTYSPLSVNESAI